MKTYKIDPLGKNRPLMLVRGTRLPESFPDSVAEHMAKSLKANCRGVFTTINGEISSLTASPGVVISREANEDNNTLVVMTEGWQNESVDWEDSTGKQFRLEHEGSFEGSQYGGNDPYYTGAYKDLRTFVTGAVPYTGQPLVAANAKQWYSYTTPEGVSLTFRGCIQAPVKGGDDFVGLKIDSINFLSSDSYTNFKLTLDCDSAISLGLRNGMNDNSKPFNMNTGIGWLQIVATDDFKSHIHEFDEAFGNGDSFINTLEAYDGFTYNVELAAINTAGDLVPAGNTTSFEIRVKNGSALENSIIANTSGYACESLGYDMSGLGNTFPFVEEVFPTLNAEPTVVNLTTDNHKSAVVIRFSNVQDGEKLHLDLSGDVDTSGVIYFRSMNTAVLGSEFIGTGEKNFVIDIPQGDDVFAFFDVFYTTAGTLTFSRTKEVVPSQTPGFYSAEGQLIKAMTKEEVETDYTNLNCPSETTQAIKNATKFVWPEGVVKAGDYVFYGCTDLTSVTIPNTVTTIGDNAFSNCTGLTSVTIPEGVTSIGARAFSNCTGLTSASIPNTVTSIGAEAFRECSGLTSVEIPEGVTKIEDLTFTDCTGLTSVTIPNTVTTIGANAFSDCTGLTSVTIPEGVTVIDMNAFLSCIGLTSVTIPSTVTTIGPAAFSGCTDLNPLIVPNTVTSIGDIAFENIPKVIYGGSATGSPWGATLVVAPPPTPGFYNSNNQLVKAMTKEEVEQNYVYGHEPSATDEAVKNATNFVWPEGVTGIGLNVFKGCSGLTSVTIPEGVTSIGQQAFLNCTGLTSVTIPSTVTSIGPNAFERCSGLTSVTIPEGVTSIEGTAFAECSSLTSVTIPNTVTTINGSAFGDCTSLNPLTIPNTVTTIGNNAFKNVPKVIYGGSASGTPWGALEVVEPQTPGFYSAEGQLIKAMTKEEVEQDYEDSNYPAISNEAVATSTKFVWPEGVTKVGYRMFKNCTGLTEVAIPITVTEIGFGAFDGCTGLTSVTIPEGVRFIGSAAFSGCTSLATAVIPSTVGEIDNYAFDNCSSLTSVAIPESMTEIALGTFSGCSALASVTIPNTVTSIGGHAFEGCTSVNPLTVPNTVATIGVDAFKNVPKVIYSGSAEGSPWGATEVAAS